MKNGLQPDLILLECSTGGLKEWADCRRFIQNATSTKVCLLTNAGDHDIRQHATELGISSFLTIPVTRTDIESLISSENIDAVNLVSVPSVFPDVGVSTTKHCNRAGDSAELSCFPYIEELGEGRYFLAASPRMLKIHQQIKRLAKYDVNVLILGESGTGKEVIAHLIHKHSVRCQAKFVNVNCAALPGDLLESELFGHRQGAFTGAIRDSSGKFEQAHKGTILLDEIGEMPVQMQAKLLHVLQDGQFTRLGGQESTRVDVRVLAATNIQMEEALREKIFRDDLYYRLSAFTIWVPPLRERREEIPYLIEETIRRAPAGMACELKESFPSRLMDVALLYDWRGNVRELRNFVTRMLIMRDPDAAARDLEAKVAEASMDAEQLKVGVPSTHCSGIRSAVRDVKDRAEARIIQDALDVFGWNRRRAAQYLNISYRGLLYKIQQHQLCPTHSSEAKSVRRKASSVAKASD